MGKVIIENKTNIFTDEQIQEINNKPLKEIQEISALTGANFIVHAGQITNVEYNPEQMLEEEEIRAKLPEFNLPPEISAIKDIIVEAFKNVYKNLSMCQRAAENITNLLIDDYIVKYGIDEEGLEILETALNDMGAPYEEIDSIMEEIRNIVKDTEYTPFEKGYSDTDDELEEEYDEKEDYYE